MPDSPLNAKRKNCHTSAEKENPFRVKGENRQTLFK